MCGEHLQEFFLEISPRHPKGLIRLDKFKEVGSDKVGHILLMEVIP
jgi:hypothetical protein